MQIGLEMFDNLKANHINGLAIRRRDTP